ncbi:kinase-like domain-containing protein [Hyaloscypha finlandica]|nr:kinase-like domain-containing protein [Hyaloscypha finlandica]
MAQSQVEPLGLLGHAGVTLTSKAITAALSKGFEKAKTAYKAPEEVEALEEQITLMRVVIEDVDAVQSDVLSSTAIKAAWWRLNSKLLKLEDRVENGLKTGSKNTDQNDDMELQDLESQIPNSGLSSGPTSTKKWAWSWNKDDIMALVAEVKEFRGHLSFALQSSITACTRRIEASTNRIEQSLMAPHDIVNLPTPPALSEAQLLPLLFRLGPIQLENLLKSMQTTIQRQENLFQQFGNLRLGDQSDMLSARATNSVPEGTFAPFQAPPTSLSVPDAQLDTFRFTLPAHAHTLPTHDGVSVRVPQAIIATESKFYLNHVSDIAMSDGGRGYKYLISCLTSQGWQRFTIEFESTQTMASIGLLTQTYRQREEMVSTLINAMWDSIASNNFSYSTTNLTICRNLCGYFARCTVDLDNSTELPRLSDNNLQLESISETTLKVTHHWGGWVYVVTREGADESVEYVKREIPTQEQVESFNSELYALSHLQNSRHNHLITNLFGVVTDPSGTYIKGMLVESLFPLAVFIRSNRGNLSWTLKLKWAKQILSALAAIHDMGVIMGEVNGFQFGLTRDWNIKVMGIKKRGCPTGWQSPEYQNTPKGRAAGIFGPPGRGTGQKLDMYQVGLLLSVLAKEEFPEEHEDYPPPPLMEDVPEFYRRIVETCLQTNPEDRREAAFLVDCFPDKEVRGTLYQATPLVAIASRL